MNTRFAPILLFALCGLCAAPGAQGTITSGNTTYTVGPISATQADSISADFSGNPASDPDVLFEHWHYYRIDGDTEENAFKNDGTLTQSYVGSHADLDWADVDNRGLISAMLDLDVFGSAADRGFVFAQMTITNISQTALTLDFFTYVDADVCGAGGHTAVGTGDVQVVTGVCPAGDELEFAGFGIDHWCATTFSGSECGILDGAPTTLPDTGLPFSPGDWVGALQWADRTLNPGESITFASRLEHNPAQCGNEASASNYGAPLGGTGGPPTFVTTTLPEIFAFATMRVGNTPPNAAGAMLLGFQRANQQIGNLTLLVQSVDSLPLVTDGAGTVSLSIQIPSPTAISGVCGAVIDFQYLYADPTVQGQFPVGHTDGLEWVIGR